MITLFCGALVLLIGQTALAQEWAQWRGPNRDGVANHFQPPAAWPKTLTKKWQTPVGGGFSSPIVAAGKVYVHTRQDEREVVSCLDLKTGKVLWSKNYPAAFTKNQYAIEMGKGPHSTPVLHGGMLYTLGVTAVLSCFDAKTGDLKWRKDFSNQIDTSKLFCGTAMSPVIEKDFVIAHVGDDRGGAMIAFDLKTGKEKWVWKGDGPGYASPIIVDLEGVRQLVTLTDKSAIGVAVDSGKLLWSLPFPDEWNENIITPILFEKTLILSGVRQGTKAIQLTKSGDKWEVRQLWHNPKVAMYMSSPVLDGHYLYGLSHLRKGQYFCLDARTGEALWMTDGREGRNAAVLSAGKEVLFFTDDADLVVAKKSAKGLETVAKYTVADSAVWSHPVLLDKQILVKDSATLTLWAIE
ncbi:MAG TPA: PQQ-binding-like beta-propeller repeat protein [Blastocatellia bacterium]|nr:PQQ-binding-like beta-propeller repeat protein [Blastocatellia bacterium]